MKKSCSEIFGFRKHMFTDATFLSRNPRKASLRPPKRRVRDTVTLDTGPRDHQTYTFPGPCHHPGSCNDACPCVRANVPCERKCLCDEFCPLRVGCNCRHQRSSKKGRRVKGICCRTVQCSCRRAQRACNPEQCTGCAITNPQVPTCLNMAALWAANGCQKAVEVRKSAYGYGLYLKESILAGEFLMEYTGEAILESTCLSRDHIIAHRERNYLFDLNTTLRVDSSLAGDPSRFINHGDTPNLVDGDEGAGEGFANVSSYVEIANGGHGVMLYADIDMDAGTELLLDYGPKFFKQVHDDGENEEENEEEPKEREVILRYKGYGYDDPEYGGAEEYRE
ncbi:Histone-lysine N-methyltransferase EZH1/2-like protein [Pleurotus pulmonarius]